MNDEQIKAKLTKLAAEMILGRGMPIEFVTDWHLPKTTPMKARRLIHEATSEARAQCREWAKRIMEIADNKERE